MMLILLQFLMFVLVFWVVDVVALFLGDVEVLKNAITWAVALTIIVDSIDRKVCTCPK